VNTGLIDIAIELGIGFFDKGKIILFAKSIDND
jgi:hypothetical protein